MDANQQAGRTAKKTQKSWLTYAVIVLVVEKVIQHVTVTLALRSNWGDIRTTVALNPTALMVLGAIVGVLFAVGLWGIVMQKRWAPNLVIGLAVFDIVGEFVAQGKLGIEVTVSFLVAALLLVLALLYRREVYGRKLLPV